jgi:rod shape determining protein RodA
VRKYFLASILFLFALISLTILRSIVPDLLYKQSLAFLLAFIVFFVLSQIPFSFFLRYSRFLYIALNLLLLGLLIWGRVSRGITAWISLPFGFRFQPSQMAVPITALYLASLLTKEKKLNWFELAQVVTIILIPTALILFEPDFGTAFVFFVAMSIFVIFNRLDFQKILSLFSLGIIAFSALWLFVLEDYQKSRLFGFSNLQQNQQLILNQEETSAEYNARQALIAVGSGKFWGRGLGQGVQSQLRFLPERQTDFIFASFAEEWGFLGAVIILSLYFVFLLFIWINASRVSKFSEKLYIISIFTMFLTQLFINIGMNLALIPITGITLPFLSYGGSSIISFFFSLGILQSIIANYQKEAALKIY